jgi:hypothetical protein
MSEPPELIAVARGADPWPGRRAERGPEAVGGARETVLTRRWRGRERLAAALALVLLGALEPAAAQVNPAAPPAAHEAIDLRGWELLRHECSSELSRREITLFANGTLRRREGPPGEEEMSLVELSPRELEGFVNRLGDLDLAEAERHPGEVGGQWVEHCALTLHLLDRPEQRFTFGRYDSLSLSLTRLLAVARELGSIADERAIGRHLPTGYEPQSGDVLERVDGLLFRITGFTADGTGIELQGVEQPLVVYIDRSNLTGQFVELVERRGTAP